MEVPLAWERQLWRGRPTLFLPHLHVRGQKYVLTDMRLVSVRAGRVDELAIDDIGEVGRSQSAIERVLGVSTIEVQPKDARRPPLVVRGVRRGAQLAALVDLLATDPRAGTDAESVEAALATLSWEPRIGTAAAREAIVGLAAVVIAVFAVVAGLHGTNASVLYPPDDAIYPNGRKASRADIVRFMQSVVMPWAREALAPVVGGPARVTCVTCHGQHPESIDWQTPAVAALPRPSVRDAGWETSGATMDAQMRNAIYGYAAEPAKQAKATYMREVVVPGMAGLLHRPPYDFTQPYEYNRSRFAFGCYHCHKVK